MISLRSMRWDDNNGGDRQELFDQRCVAARDTPCCAPARGCEKMTPLWLECLGKLVVRAQR